MYCVTVKLFMLDNHLKLGGQGEPQGTHSADYKGAWLHTDNLPSQTKQMLQTTVLIANTGAKDTHIAWH